MSGHRASRRRDYGRRQKDVRARRVDLPPIDLDGPALWVRGRAWDQAVQRPSSMTSSRGGQRPVAADGSLGSPGR